MLPLVETRKVFTSGRLRDVVFWKKGEIFEHPLGYRLVQHGIAEPVDDECKFFANLTPAEMQIRQHNYERLKRGINPEDWDAYDKGYMTGYAPDGSGAWVPGPNYAE